MRIINDTVSQWPCGRYFVCIAGDELLLKATNDADAIAEGAAMVKEFEAFEAESDVLATIPTLGHCAPAA